MEKNSNIKHKNNGINVVKGPEGLQCEGSKLISE